VKRDKPTERVLMLINGALNTPYTNEHLYSIAPWPGPSYESQREDQHKSKTLAV
jgi:hypothetical protein